ncbi:6818_t:CDS:1 [Diversispora eburnea]|uniref:6818_t:CDS:1 n=1 Tax=Diversispora eburnea TaxID=1213867 RepID=A0A9N9EXU7_9GLOM|nr:6818_t:CDS:1 [Diversispora eburnea]
MTIFDILNIEIIGNDLFKYVDSPYNLTLSCKRFYNISSRPTARAKWIIRKYGRAHALFHSIRLGPNFINIPLVKCILANNGILSRYFIQRLLMHFGKYDKKLIELKIEHNAGQIDEEKLKQKVKSPWASNLSIPVFTFLISEASSQLKIEELTAKGNDMELFHFLSAGPHVISDAPDILFRNMDNIKELIHKMKFIPFPPRPKKNDLPSIPEEYPPKDGYENSRQLNVIARAILICKDLVPMWIEIGYYQICEDVNDLVMQGATLILFPPSPTPNYAKPDATKVIERLDELINLGFNLTYSVIGDILQLFENRLTEVGDILFESILKIKTESYKDSIENFTNKVIEESIKPERNLKNSNLWSFLNQKLAYHINIMDFNKYFPKITDYEIQQMQQHLEKFQEKAFLKAIKSITNYNSTAASADSSNFANIRGSSNIFNSNQRNNITSLKLSSRFYNWVIREFKNESEIVSICFDDILKTRVSINQQLIANPNVDIPSDWKLCSFKNALNIWGIYCNNSVPFKPNHLQYLSQATHNDILSPFFKGFLPRLFQMSITFTQMTIDNSSAPIFNRETESSFPPTQQFNENNDSYIVIEKKRKFESSETDGQNGERYKWKNLLENLRDSSLFSNRALVTSSFKRNLEEFLGELNDSKFMTNQKLLPASKAQRTHFT